MTTIAQSAYPYQSSPTKGSRLLSGYPTKQKVGLNSYIHIARAA
jgi:hypothetical protein